MCIKAGPTPEPLTDSVTFSFMITADAGRWVT
jgi:hypothetical protein